MPAISNAAYAFELSGPRRKGPLAARPMIAMAGSRPGCLAGVGPLERRVRPHFALADHYYQRDAEALGESRVVAYDWSTRMFHVISRRPEGIPLLN